MENRLQKYIDQAFYDVNYITTFRYPPPQIKPILDARDYYNLAMNLIQTEIYGRRKYYHFAKKAFEKAATLTGETTMIIFYLWLRDNIDLLYEAHFEFWLDNY